MALNAYSEKKLKGVNPDLVAVVRLAHSKNPPGFDWGIVQGNRTQAEQAALYAKGRTKPGPKVTWTLNSRHIGGYAVDVVHLEDLDHDGKIEDLEFEWNKASAYTTISHLMKAAAVSLGIAVEWGPDVGIKGDLGHYQLNLGKYPKGSTRSYLKIPISVAPSITPTPYTPPKPPIPSPLPSNVQVCLAYFIAKGLPKFQAAAIVGNLQQESYLDLRISAAGDGGKAHSLPQWSGGRWEHYLGWAKSMGLDPNIASTVCGGMWHELETTEKAALDALKKTKTVEEATEVFMRKYERPSDVASLTKRITNAKNLLA